MKRSAALAVACALFGLSACSHHKLQAGEARLELSRGGSALVADRGGKLVRTTSAKTLHRGARIKVVSGSASVRLADGSSIEMQPAAEVHLDARPLLVSGDVLVTAGSRGPLTVDAGDGSAEVAGVGRLTRGFGLDIESYRRVTTLHSAGRDLAIKAPRHAALAALGVLPNSADPISYDEADAAGWDQRYLGSAIDLGRRLSEPVRAFSQSLRPGEGRTVGFYRQLLPALDQQPLDDGLLAAVPQRRPDEGLVGAAVALASKQGSFADRWQAVFGFRAQGAQWGLVALDQDVSDADGLSKTVLAALNRAPVDFASTSATPGTATPIAPASRPTGTTTTTTTPPSQGGGGGTTTTTTQPSGPVPTPPPTGTPLDPLTQPIVQPVVDTLNGLLGGGG
jgi:hypothetical protein